MRLVLNRCLPANLRWLDAAMLALYVAVAGAVVLHHEPWADEAQAWLLARDLGWFRLIFSELHWEGHPGLWYTILWTAIHWFHAGYPALGWIGLACAACGAAVLIFLAPFPRPLRYLIAFSFYFFFQYTVVARSYNLMPLLAFLSAWLYRRGNSALVPLTLTLSLLSAVSAHGILIALAFAVGFAGHALFAGATPDPGFRKAFLRAALGFSAVLLALIALLPDTTVAYEAQKVDFYGHVRISFGAIEAAFSPYKWLSCVIAALLYLWCAKRKIRMIFLISVLGNAVLIGFVRGRYQHLGILVVASVTALWCGWPAPGEVSAFEPKRLSRYRASVAALGALFSYHCLWSAEAVRSDWLLPYSGARDAAAWLKSSGADHQSIEAFDFICVAIQPYFSRNIFVNFQASPGTAFYRNSVASSRPMTLTPWTRPNTDWVVAGVSSTNVDLTVRHLEQSGYALVHVSGAEGFYFPTTPVEMQSYLIFRRNSAFATQ